MDHNNNDDKNDDNNEDEQWGWTTKIKSFPNWTDDSIKLFDFKFYEFLLPIHLIIFIKFKNKKEFKI